MRRSAIAILLFFAAGVWPAACAAPDGRSPDDDGPRTLHVAVATNFTVCLQELAPVFTAATGIDVIASSAATGILYAQIEAGAPFDVFLAADERRPGLLVANGLAAADSRLTYAVGRVVLWAPAGALGWRRECPVDTLATVLRGLLADEARPLALTEPRHAPYGLAAEQILVALGLWDAAEDNMAVGLNVGQTWQHVATGNAAAGFVALSQLRAAWRDHHDWTPGTALLVPASLHAPIVQQAVLLRASRNGAAARRFLTYLTGEDARRLLASYGYETVGPAP